MLPSSWFWVLEGKMKVVGPTLGGEDWVVAPFLWIPEPNWKSIHWKEARILQQRGFPDGYKTGFKALDALSVMMVKEVLMNKSVTTLCRVKAVEFLCHHLKLEPEKEKRKKVGLQQVLDNFNKKVDEAVTISSLTGDLGCSPSHLHKLFKANLGIGPMEALSEYRLGQAAQKLIGGSESITTVAYSVGYRDLATFSHAFKRKFKMSPRTYRQQGQWLI